MRISQSGIHGDRPTTRFAAPAADRRERQFGLRRAARGQRPVTSGVAVSVAPLAAIRHAARSLVAARLANTPAQAAGPMAPRLRRAAPISWSQPNGSVSRRPRPRSAAPWRG